MIDRACNLAHLLVVDAAHRSAALAQYFIEQASAHPDHTGAVAEKPPQPWPPLQPDELSLGFVMAVNMIRGAGFAAEADRLAALSEVGGHA